MFVENSIRTGILSFVVAAVPLLFFLTFIIAIIFFLVPRSALLLFRFDAKKTGQSHDRKLLCLEHFRQP